MVILIFLIFLNQSPVKAFTNELTKIENIIESIGTKVFWSQTNSFCKEGLLGAYIPTEDIVVICQDKHDKNYEELIATLKHEGWHAAQLKCNKSMPILTDDEINIHLRNLDRRILHSYHPGQARLEAEARVIEQLPTKSFINGFKYYCKKNRN